MTEVLEVRANIPPLLNLSQDNHENSKTSTTTKLELLIGHQSINNLEWASIPPRKCAQLMDLKRMWVPYTANETFSPESS
jgi:hypothetical protein